MIINHNMNAMNAHRMMSGNTSAAGRSMEKLSSGLRINRAGDDAAGLAISEKMRGQIRGLDQAGRNSQDAISLIQTAEGALNESHSILQRMRELSVQSANDTNVSSDRTEIQRELSQLTSEINRIGNTTEFNTQSLLNGSVSKTAKGMSGYNAHGTGVNTVLVDKGSSLNNGSYSLVVSNTTIKSGTPSTTLNGGISNVRVAENSTLAASSAAYSIDIATTAIKTKATGEVKDNGITAISVAGNSTLAASNYKIAITRTDAATNYAAGGTGIASVTVTSTGATGITAGAYHVDTTSKISGVSTTAGSTIIKSMTIDDQAKFATWGKGGANLAFNASNGKILITGSDGTTAIAATITLDISQQSYKVYSGGNWTGITINTATNASGMAGSGATDTGTFDVDSVLTVKSGSTTLASTTVIGGAATGTVTLSLGGGNAGNITINHNGTKATAAGTLTGSALLANGSATFNVANKLSAQLMTGAASIGASVSFNAGDVVNLSSGVGFTSSATAANYSASAAENSTFSIADSTGYIATLKDGASAQIGNSIFVENNTAGYTFGNGVTFDAGTLAAGSGTFKVSETSAFAGALKDASGSTIASKTLQTNKTVDFGSGIKAVMGSSLSAGTANFSVNSSTDGTLSMQVGANMGQKFGVDIEDMRAHAIGVSGSSTGETILDKDGNLIEGAAFVAASNVTNGTDNSATEYSLDISSASKATAAIKVIDKAIQTVSAERSKLGAFQNRVEHTIANLGTASENLTAAESRIRDVDMAKEMMTFSKNNILSQAAQAMLAQANQQPQGVLQLLR